jgi:hypothetical protein
MKTRQQKMVFSIVLGRLLLETLDDVKDDVLFRQEVKSSIKNCHKSLESIYNRFFDAKDTQQDVEVSDVMGSTEKMILDTYKICIHFEKEPKMLDLFTNDFNAILAKYKIDV